jgi:hypothetical protein
MLPTATLFDGFGGAMAIIHFDPLVIGAFGQLSGAGAFLEVVGTAIPTLEAAERQHLEKLATQEGWDLNDYNVGRIELDSKFQTWVPTFAAYSVLILLHSIAECQLHALAERLGQKTGSNIRVKHLAGRGIDQAVCYLERVVSLDVKADPSWPKIVDLKELRNIIVHRGGRRGASQEQGATLEGLLRKYPVSLRLQKADGIHEQLWVSMDLCGEFAHEVEGFFERVFKLAGLPTRHMHQGRSKQ